MVDTASPAIHELFERIFQTVPNAARNLDFDALDADTSARGLILKRLEEIVAPSRPNFLIGYSGHINFAVSLATNLNIAYGTAYKTPDPQDRNGFNVFFNKQYLLSCEESLGEKLRLFYIDDSIETGYAAEKVIRQLRTDGFVINDAVFLIEAEGHGGREKLSKLNVNVHSLAIHSPESGFRPGLSPITTAMVGFGTDVPEPTDRASKHKSGDIVLYPVLRATRPHNTRPGNFPKARLI